MTTTPREALAEALATYKGWIGLQSMPRERREQFYSQADSMLAHLAAMGFKVQAK